MTSIRLAQSVLIALTGGVFGFFVLPLIEIVSGLLRIKTDIPSDDFSKSVLSFSGIVIG